MDDQAQPAKDGKSNPFNRVPIEIKVTVGKAHPSVGELLQLEQNALLPLDKRVSDPVELYVGDKLIACGELEELDGEQEGQLAVRLIKVAELDDDI